MTGRILLALFGLAAAATRAQAVAATVTYDDQGNQVYTYNTSAPTSADIPDWDSGWGESGVTGWDYVGTVNEASGVYLGNGWVLTAGHVGAGDFTLNSGGGNATYSYNGVSHSFSDANGPTDLTVFQLETMPSLPPLSLATSDPSDFVNTSAGDNAAMIGYGNGIKAWGYDNVTIANQLINPENTSFVSNDFVMALGSVSNMTTSSPDNQAYFIGGDSGGGTFIYNAALQKWQLAGINEVDGNTYLEYIDGAWTLSDNDDTAMGAQDVQAILLSGSVQVDTYATEIEDAVPEPPVWLLALAGAGAVASARTIRRARPAHARG